MTDNDAVCGISSPTLTIDHPDLIVSYADGPITVQATFASAQSTTPTLVYTDFGGTTSLTMDVVSGTTDRKQWDYEISFSGPDEQKLLTVGSSSVTVTFDSMPSQIYSTEVNQEGTAVDVIFTEDLFASYISNVATGTVSITDFSLTLSSTTASLTSSTPTSMSVASTTLTDGKIYNLGFSLNGTASVGDVLSVGVSTDTYDIAGNAVSSSLTSNTATYKVSETTEEVTLKLTSDSSSTDLTNCDDIKFTATFNTDVSSPVILQITDSSTTTYQLGMTPVTSTASSSVASDSTFTTWEANWSATASYSLGSLTMTVSHTGAQVISTTNTSTIAKLEFNLTDNDAVCGVPQLISSDTTWTLSNSPYYITDNVNIQQGVTLTIEPGVIVNFFDDKYLKVEGNIIASGTSTQTIEFLSSTSTGTWEGIKIRPTSITSLTIDLQNQNYTYQSGSVFNFVRFKNANKALYVFDTSIYVANSSFELCNYGVEIRATENVIIKDNTFSGIDRSNNTIGIYTHSEDNSSGDYVNEIANTVIAGNIFINNHLGLSLNMNQRVFKDFNVLNNIIKSNTTGIQFSGGGYGARVNGVIIKENKIFDNTQNGVSIGKIYGGPDYSNSDNVLLSFEKNTVVDNPILWDFGGGTSGVQISIKNNIIYNTRTDEYNYGIKFNGGLLKQI